MDVKGQNPKAQPSTLKTEAMRRFKKIINFAKNLKKLKIHYLKIGLFMEKRPIKIKPRLIGCSVFFVKVKLMYINMY